MLLNGVCGMRSLVSCGAAGGVQAKGLVPEHVLATQVDPACFELSGHLVLKRAVDFEAISQVGPLAAPLHLRLRYFNLNLKKLKIFFCLGPRHTRDAQ